MRNPRFSLVLPSKLLLAGSLVAGWLALGDATEAAAEVEKLPPSGTTHFTTYFSVHPAYELKMVEDNTMTVAELVGITRNPDGKPYFDNMVVRCLVSIRVVKASKSCMELARRPIWMATAPRRPSTARHTISSAARVSTRGFPGQRRSRFRACHHPVRASARSSYRMRSLGSSSEPN